MNDVKFELVSSLKPTGDQPNAIKYLVDGVKSNKKYQVLLGATGTGKTFTLANVIAKCNKPTLVLVHNKTLAGQLYQELKSFFPNNRVEYFISNFDFYQPEAYIASSDTYIEKSAMINEEIEMMRVSAINSLVSHNDVIVVASVASIYGLTDPNEYKKLIFEVREGESINRNEFLKKLIDSQYTRNDFELSPGRFRVNGDSISIMEANNRDNYIRIELFDDEVEGIFKCDYITGKRLESYKVFSFFPAYDHASSKEVIERACDNILKELETRIKYFKDEGKLLEAERIELRTKQDVDKLLEFGMCPGIENYSRLIDGRKEGEKPFCLFDYFPKDYLLIIDESHVTIPQIRGMYNGDRSRKETLVNYGFRLPSALDNRPLNFGEFEEEINQVIFDSATPGDYELNLVNQKYVEQIIRPTGLLDPLIEVRPSLNQIDDLINEIKKRVEKKERVMIVTLTIKMAEDLTNYLKEKEIKTVYLHSECKTLERSQIIYELRKGKYDCLVGINLLREGLDIPEVSLVAILDADKEGFLRSERSLIQTVGRCARNENGKAIMYADSITLSMQKCIDETKRRRDIQDAYNKDNGIIPMTIKKEIISPLHVIDKDIGLDDNLSKNDKLNKKEIEIRIKELQKLMQKAAKEFDFEAAIKYRDTIISLKEMIK